MNFKRWHCISYCHYLNSHGSSELRKWFRLGLMISVYFQTVIIMETRGDALIFFLRAKLRWSWKWWQRKIASWSQPGRDGMNQTWTPNYQSQSKSCYEFLVRLTLGMFIDLYTPCQIGSIFMGELPFSETNEIYWSIKWFVFNYPGGDLNWRLWDIRQILWHQAKGYLMA